MIHYVKNVFTEFINFRVTKVGQDHIYYIVRNISHKKFIIYAKKLINFANLIFEMSFIQ